MPAALRQRFPPKFALGFFVFLLARASSHAAPIDDILHPPRRLGLGLTIGQPSGLSGKIWLDATHAVDFAAGSFGYYTGSSYNGVNIHVDYLWHRYGLFGRLGSDARTRMPLYVGVGALFTAPNVAGVRVPFGITYLFRQPFDMFFELAPTLILAPAAGSGVDAGLGGRFYF